VIGAPVNDGECLEQLTALVVQRLAEYAPIARRFATTAELATWIRSRPQRADVGDPSDGPKLVCDVPQRVRVPATFDPNCFERAALYLGAAEWIDPAPLRQLATIGDASGQWRHTFPLENGQPVVLDPDLGNANAPTSPATIRGVRAARNAVPARAVPPPTREQELLRWLCELAEAPAFALGGEEALAHVHYARRVLAQLGMLDNARRPQDCARTLEALRSSSAPEAVLARYDLGLVVALAEQAAPTTDQPELALTLVVLSRGTLANLGLLSISTRNQLLDPYSTPPGKPLPPPPPMPSVLDPYPSTPATPAPRPTPAPSFPTVIDHTPWTPVPTPRPASTTPAPSFPTVLDPYPSTPATAPRPTSTTPAPSFPSVLDPYPSTPAKAPAPPPPSSVGNLSPVTPIGVPSLPSTTPQQQTPNIPPDRYSADDEENAIFTALATEQRLLAEDAANEAAAKFAAAVNGPPSKPKKPQHHKRQVLDPSNDPQLAAILDASLAQSKSSGPVARNCACGGACGACRRRALERVTTSTRTSVSASTIIARYRNCPCGGACAMCVAIACKLPRNFDWQSVGDVVHTVGGAVLDAYGAGALKEPIGNFEQSIGFIHKQPSVDDQAKAILAKLNPEDRAKAKAVFDSLTPDQKKQLVAFLSQMPPDQAAAFVHQNLGAAAASMASASSSSSAPKPATT
jgi:hypothetical protein